jgi:hypothetical protein
METVVLGLVFKSAGVAIAGSVAEKSLELMGQQALALIVKAVTIGALVFMTGKAFVPLFDSLETFLNILDF